MAAGQIIIMARNITISMRTHFQWWENHELFDELASLTPLFPATAVPVAVFVPVVVVVAAVVAVVVAVVCVVVAGSTTGPLHSET